MLSYLLLLARCLQIADAIMIKAKIKNPPAVPIPINKLVFSEIETN